MLSNADFLDSCPGSDRLQGAFLISGIYDLREIVHTSVNHAVQLPTEWAVSLSPMFDCFRHLQARRVRLYILAGQYDSPTFKKQSREFYELLHNTCLMQNMYLEIKDNLDHFDIVECFANQDNYLKNLLVHDIRKHLWIYKSKVKTEWLKVVFILCVKYRRQSNILFPRNNDDYIHGYAV